MKMEPDLEALAKSNTYIFDRLARKTSLERLYTLGLVCQERKYIHKIFSQENKKNPDASPNNVVIWANGMNEDLPTRILIAHYDIINASGENANDNTAGIFIALEYLEAKNFPQEANIIVVFTDKEERGGLGATMLGDLIKQGIFGSVEFILNLDVVGCGDTIYCDDKDSPLAKRLIAAGAKPRKIPFNDAVALRSCGMDSVLLCANDKDATSYAHWTRLHQDSDTLDTLNGKSMKKIFLITTHVFGNP